MPLRNPWGGCPYRPHPRTAFDTLLGPPSQPSGLSRPRPRPREGRILHNPQIPSKIDGWVRLVGANMQASGV